ncbi:hypothetical protein K490DRAFT_55378 [Saccharata proteae CBS 121410]|uniref:F-box domain-containing protein n=1 Tax=Saccharata proteae CBS 121410 TaxID=1314787 RepID=A0A6A5YA65_9PEZI|nr:hypothetical protein K490DRAFT_55378 [Saccharata proteae CBS 121410]
MTASSPYKVQSQWSLLPAEVILEVLSDLDFDFQTLQNLRLVDRRLNGILKTFERSLAKQIASKQFRHILPRFPDLAPPSRTLSFELLAHVNSRHSAVSKLKSQAFKYIGAPCRCFCRVGWESMFEAGTLLFYQLYDRKDYDSKVAFIKSLPDISLAAMFAMLFQCVIAASIGGVGLIHQDNQPDDPMARSDVHLVFEDLVLQFGPQFAIDILDGDHEAAETLESQWINLESAQLHNLDGETPRQSLISVLKRTFADQAGCLICEVAGKMFAMAKSRKSHDIVGLLAVDVPSKHKCC